MSRWNVLSCHMAVLLCAMVSIMACGQEASTTPGEVSCAEGERLNPINGMCEAVPSGTTQDMSQPKKDMRMPAVDAGDPVGEPDLALPPDMDVMPDLPVVQEDMGMDEPDLEVMPDMPPMVEHTTRFVALGDTGEGNEAQRRVGQAMGQVCAQYGGCEFALLLGDNAYDSGVDGPDDPFFMDMFVTPYSHLNFPFYVVLGNHDLGGDGLGLSLDTQKGDYQIQYGQMNPQWIMPAKFYEISEQHEHVWLLGLNTTNIFFGQDAEQRGMVPDWIRDAPLGDWKIAFGHHPFISNGKHGNAGEYEGLPFIPIANGEHIESFMQSFICGQIDLYICGHDHSLQDLQATCGTEFIVSGAGAKTTEVKGDNPAHFDASQLGFFMFEVTSSEIEVYTFDDQQNLLHRRTITR